MKPNFKSLEPKTFSTSVQNFVSGFLFLYFILHLSINVKESRKTNSGQISSKGVDVLKKEVK